MGVNKREIVPIVFSLDKLYYLFSKAKIEYSEFANNLSIAAKFCIKIHPLFHNNSSFISLFNYVYQLFNSPSFFKNESISAQSDLKFNNRQRSKLLCLLEQFELSLIEDTKFDIYLYNCNDMGIPVNNVYVENIVNLSINTEVQKSFPLFQVKKQNLSVGIHSSLGKSQGKVHTDFCIQAEEITNSLENMTMELNNLNYYTHDKLYLEAKLESLRRRQDIRILLSGSSYTMCGLFEEQMPLPARNVAVDAQDLYYTLKTIRTALNYNSNIKHCIISFAYYFWGYDLSLSTSSYQYRRITEVNYPVFKDKHNFSCDIDDEISPLLTTVTPLKKRLFSFDMLAEQFIKNLKSSFEESRYYPYIRVESEVLRHDEITNQERANIRASSHNKFFKYIDTVQENQNLFADFASEMNTRGVQLILYVPPVTKYYRKSIDPTLITNFYGYMKPFQEIYSFKLIDLFNSDVFENDDFVDYDHLNDRGAKKLAEILVKELDF